MNCLVAGRLKWPPLSRHLPCIKVGVMVAVRSRCKTAKNSSWNWTASLRSQVRTLEDRLSEATSESVMAELKNEVARLQEELESEKQKRRRTWKLSVVTGLYELL